MNLQNKVANNYRILLDVTEYFFCIIFTVLHIHFYSCNANKKWSEEINIEKWGWKLSQEGIEPIWTTLAEASQACRELIKCNCGAICMKCCCCKKQNLKCTQLCGRSRGCDKKMIWHIIHTSLEMFLQKEITHNSYLFCCILLILVRVFRTIILFD